MTQIDFYTHAPDRLTTACRLTAKARSQGLRVTLFVPDPTLAAELDTLLWTTPAASFLPHCAPTDPLAAQTPIHIDTTGETQHHDDLMINLHSSMPSTFSRYQRLVEIVSSDEADRVQARDRYKFYRDRGYAIKTHDLSAK